MPLRTVLFDLDGTLIDHFRAIHRCHAYAMRQVGLPEPTYEQVHAAIGRGLEDAVIDLAGADYVQRILPHYFEHWQKTNLDDVVLLPGALDLIVTLRARGVTCAVLTNKRGEASRAVCAHLGLTPLLAGIFGDRDTPWIKPDRRFADHALVTLGADAETTVLVGDSVFDLAAAQNARLDFLGVTTGTHTAAELRAAGATQVFASLEELAPALLGPGE